jgi:sortase B
MKFKKIIRELIPVKGDSKKQIILKIVFIAAVITFVISAWQIVAYYADTYFASKDYSRTASDYKFNPSDSSEYSEPSSNAVSASSSKPVVRITTDFKVLLKDNRDTKGFIIVPGTNIYYPVVQTSDNKYYLTHNFYKGINRYGCPFIDMRDRVNPLSKNLIIYGHNMKDNLMFGGLLKYKTLSFYKNTSVFDFNTIYKNIKWKVFAVFVANTDPANGDVFNYNVTEFASKDDFNLYIAQVKQRSFINTNVDVSPDENILTLSTCSYDFTSTQTAERFVVMARPLRPGESLDQNAAVLNPSPRMPEMWYKVKGKTMPTFTEPVIKSSGSSSSPASSAIAANAVASSSGTADSSSVSSGSSSASNVSSDTSSGSSSASNVPIP